MNQLTFDQLPEAVSKLYNKLDNIERLLTEKAITSQPEADQPLTITQAGEILNLSVPTIYGLVSRSAIPHSKKGKRLYFSKQELLDWVKSGRRKTKDEIAEQVITTPLRRNS